MLNQQAQVVRTFRITESMEVDIDQTQYGFFWAELQNPRRDPPRSIDSPRVDLPPYLLRYSLGTFAPKVEINAGTWISINGVIYECVAAPRNRVWSQVTVGQEVQLLPIDDLYPLRCAIVPKGTQGDPPKDVPIAMWSPSEDTRDRGSYVSYQAYVPAPNHDQIDINSEVIIGGRRYTITREGLDVSTGVVDLTLRGSGRG